MNLYEILASIAVVTFVVYSIFNIIYLIDLRKTSSALRQFILRTEENLNPALDELRLTLADIRKASGDASVLIERISAMIAAVIAVEKTIEGLYDYYRKGIGEAANANIGALKAGVKAGVVNLIKNLKFRKEGSA